MTLSVFFPFVGWGFLGLAVSPELIVAALVSHVLFALFLWELAHWAFGSPRAPPGHRQAHPAPYA